MFGFGKEKVGFSVLLSMYKASCHTVLRHLLEIWNDVEKLPNIKSNSDINDFAVKNLCQGLLINCLDGTDKTTFFDLTAKEYDEEPLSPCTRATEQVPMRHGIIRL